jgi:predicted transcriptional regulator
MPPEEDVDRGSAVQRTSRAEAAEEGYPAALTAADVMELNDRPLDPDRVTIRSSATLDEAKRLMESSGARVLVVVDEGGPIGVLTQTGMARARRG